MMRKIIYYSAIGEYLYNRCRTLQGAANNCPGTRISCLDFGRRDHTVYTHIEQIQGKRENCVTAVERPFVWYGYPC